MCAEVVHGLLQILLAVTRNFFRSIQEKNLSLTSFLVRYRLTDLLWGISTAVVHPTPSTPMRQKLGVGSTPVRISHSHANCNTDPYRKSITLLS